MNNLLLGKTPVASIPLFTSQNHTSPAYVRNTGNWAADYVQKLTCISPWNSDGVNMKAGTLISPRHVAFATHFFPSAGNTIRFVAADNTVITRTISATQSLTTISSLYPDITIGRLDSDVPAGIAFAKVLPNGWESLLPNISTSRPPAIGTDQEEKLLVFSPTTITANQPGAVAYYTTPTDHLQEHFSEGLVSGDSGNPCFFLINGDLVLLTLWSGGGGGSGASVSAFKTEINAAMTTLGGGYQLTEVDLSGFEIP